MPRQNPMRERPSKMSTHPKKLTTRSMKGRKGRKGHRG